MSYPGSPDPNPYASPVAPPGVPPAGLPITPAGPPQDSLEYMRAYNYIFDNPNWLTNVLLMGLCCMGMMIPLVGFLVQLPVLGYQFEIIDWLMKSHGRQYPNFDFGRLGDYVNRGLWPFIVNLIANFVLVPVIYIGLAIGVAVVIGITGAAGDTLGPILGFVLGSIGVIVFVAVMFVATMFLAGMILRSGLAQDFAAAFQFDWLSDFVRKMWLEMILAGLFLMVTGFILEILGILALCVGLFFAIAIWIMACAHILYQLYIVYLSRGGMPIIAKVAMQQPFAPPKF